MRFRIRFAYQIVGILSVLAVALIILVIFVLGSSQRWFSRDYTYKTYLESADGLSSNMPVLYKGFTIGNVKSFKLTEIDQVEVTFTIFDTYVDRVRIGSLVDLKRSPINLGNSFVFYAGLGAGQLDDGGTVPMRSSPEGQAYINRHLASVPVDDDAISGIINNVNSLLASLNTLTLEVEAAITGTQDNSIGRILESADRAMLELSLAMGELRTSLDNLLGEIQPIVINLQTLSGSLVDPNGTVASILDSEGTVYTSLEAALQSFASTLNNVEKTTATLPNQMPQIAAIIFELRIAIQSVQDILTSVSNNPLIRNGIPTQTGPQPTAIGTSLRDVSF